MPKLQSTVSSTKESKADQGATVICNLPVRQAEDMAQKDGENSDPAEIVHQLPPPVDVTADAPVEVAADVTADTNA